MTLFLLLLAGAGAGATARAVAGAEPSAATTAAFSLSHLGVNGLFREGDLQSAAFPSNESFVFSWKAEASAPISAFAADARFVVGGGLESTNSNGLRVVGYEVTISERFVPPSSSTLLPPPSSALFPWSSGVVLAGDDPFFVAPANVSVEFPAGASMEWTVQLFCDSSWSHKQQHQESSSLTLPTPCSDTAGGLFETAPPEEWWAGADWLGGGSELRADWTMPTAAQIVHARAYVAGVGAFDFHVNGAKASDHVMDPGESVFDVKTLFVTYNITAALVSRANEQQSVHDGVSALAQRQHAVGVRLGNSKWGYLDIYANRTEAGDQSGDSTRAFRMVAVAYLADGTKSVLSSSGAQKQWVARHGPIVYDHLWHGEIYDRRQELGAFEQQQQQQEEEEEEESVAGALPSWDAAPLSEYPAGSWPLDAVVLAPKIDAVYPALQPPIRAVAKFEQTGVAVRYGNSMQLDFGENMAGVTEVSVDLDLLAKRVGGNRTLVLRLEHTEIVDTANHAFNNYFPGMEFNHSQTCNMSDWYERKWYECANQTNAFVFGLRGNNSSGVVSFMPTFTYHGFRHLEVTPFEIMGGVHDNAWVPLTAAEADAVLSCVSAVAHKTNSDLETVGGLSFHGASQSLDVVSSIFNATLRSHTSNLWSIPTDCPQREKRGWMADAGISSSSLMYFHDSMAFHSNFLKLIEDNQRKGCTNQPSTSIYGPCQAPSTTNQTAAEWFNGSVPDVTPFATGPYGGNPGTTDWQFAYVMIARAMHQHYGPLAVPALQRQWESLDLFMSYVDKLLDPATGLLLSGARGDWVPPPQQQFHVSPEEVAAFTHTLCLSYMAEIANATAQPDAAARYAARFEHNVAAYFTRFFNHNNTSSFEADDGQTTEAAASDPTSRCCFGVGAQASNVFALHLGAVPEEHLNATHASLVQAIRTFGSEPHMDVGIFGTTYIFDVLASLGESALGLEILQQTSAPSLGYMVANTATTLWEGWGGDAHHIGGGGTSRNHIMFGGGVNRFLMRAVGGLWIDETPPRPPMSGAAGDAAGWRSVHIGPSAAALDSIGAASASKATPFGTYSVSWASFSADHQQQQQQKNKKKKMTTTTTTTTTTKRGIASNAAFTPLAYLVNASLPAGSSAIITLPLPACGGGGGVRAVSVGVVDVSTGLQLGTLACSEELQGRSGTTTTELHFMSGVAETGTLSCGLVQREKATCATVSLQTIRSGGVELSFVVSTDVEPQQP